LPGEGIVLRCFRKAPFSIKGERKPDHQIDCDFLIYKSTNSYLYMRCEICKKKVIRLQSKKKVPLDFDFTWYNNDLKEEETSS
jgi:hypothetical protein